MKSFKLKFDEKKAKKQFQKKVDKIIQSDEWKEIAADYAINQIQGKTRLQKSAKDNSPLKYISEEHKKTKKKLAKLNSKGKNFGASKSNLTITGQLLESLKGQNKKRSVEIEAKGERKPYKVSKNSYAKKTPSNEELVEYLKEKGFSFIGLSEKMKKNIKKLVKEEFFRKFNKL